MQGEGAYSHFSRIRSLLGDFALRCCSAAPGSGRFTEENAAFMGKQMLAAIAYLHERCPLSQQRVDHGIVPKTPKLLSREDTQLWCW